jgi:hypothetical protein
MKELRLKYEAEKMQLHEKLKSFLTETPPPTPPASPPMGRARGTPTATPRDSAAEDLRKQLRQLQQERDALESELKIAKETSEKSQR